MNAYTPNPGRVSRAELQALFLASFRRQVKALEKGGAQVRLPSSRPTFQAPAGMAYHFKPELFIQLGGSTEFTLPDESFVLGAGELCVMPKGVAHGELARDDAKSFENVVVCFYNETIAIHLAHEGPKSKPIVDDIFFYTSREYDNLVSYLNHIGELRHHRAEGAGVAIKGLLVAVLGLLSEIVESQGASLFSETERVFRCQWLIRNNIADPELGVEVLAEQLQCSSSHLSRLFHQESGERITEYISRVRLVNALEAVRSTTLSVKEIAVSCGFSDPNYFTKVFRKATGMTPMQMRTETKGLACAIEEEPKVVYHDYAEKGFGLRAEVMKRANVVEPSTGRKA